MESFPNARISEPSTNTIDVFLQHVQSVVRFSFHTKYTPKVLCRIHKSLPLHPMQSARSQPKYSKPTAWSPNWSRLLFVRQHCI